MLLLTLWASSAVAEADAEDVVEPTRAELVVHTVQVDSPRVQELLEEARQEEWTANELFTNLGLDDLDGCYSFADRTVLRERYARWAEAVELLAYHDPEALYRWVIGLGTPPRAATAETEVHLHCLLSDLIAAADQPGSSIRLFPRISDRFGGSVSSAAELATLVDDNPRWFNRARNALVRSVVRDFHTQSYIWHRKHRLEGRPFNRVSPQAGELCRLAPGQTWKPEVPVHERCWHQTLTSEQREQEILTASAAPGLSRHHWGTDVDILGLNHTHFAEGGPLYGDWRWLDANALDRGFFQPYQTSDEPYVHMEERWHWSYYPIAQALWTFLVHNPDHFEEALFERWDHLDRRWGARRGPYFDHIREHWRSYAFQITVPDIGDDRAVRPPR